MYRKKARKYHLTVMLLMVLLAPVLVPSIQGSENPEEALVIKPLDEEGNPLSLPTPHVVVFNLTNTPPSEKIYEGSELEVTLALAGNETQSFSVDVTDVTLDISGSKIININPSNLSVHDSIVVEVTLRPILGEGDGGEISSTIHINQMLTDSWTKVGRLHSISGIGVGLRLWSGQKLYIEGKYRKYKEYYDPAPDEGWDSSGAKATINTVDVWLRGMVQNGEHRIFELYVQYAYERWYQPTQIGIGYWHEKIYPTITVYPSPEEPPLRLGEPFTCDRCQHVPTGWTKAIAYDDFYDEMFLFGVHEWWEWGAAASVSFSCLGTVLASVTVRAERKYEPDERAIVCVDKGYGCLTAYDLDSERDEWYFMRTTYCLTVLTRYTPNTDVYIDGQWRGLTGSAFPVSPGIHTLRVSDFWEYGTGWRYSFKYWFDGNMDRLRTILVVGNETYTACFRKTECPGDANGDKVVDVTDALTVRFSVGSKPGDTNWNRAADLNGDGDINVLDALTVANCFGNTYS